MSIQIDRLSIFSDTLLQSHQDFLGRMHSPPPAHSSNMKVNYKNTQTNYFSATSWRKKVLEKALQLQPPARSTTKYRRVNEYKTVFSL